LYANQAIIFKIKYIINFLSAMNENLFSIFSNVSELVQFSDVQPAPAMIYAVKQLVGHEVDSEKLRRTSLAVGTLHIDNTPTRAAKSQTKAPSVVPNHLQTLSPQILKKGPLKPVINNKTQKACI